MNILKKTKDWLSVLVERIGKFSDCAGAGIVNSDHGLTTTEYGDLGIETDSPGTPAFKKPSRTELMVALMDANNRLKVAAHALALVECMTAPNTKYTPRSVIHKIAFDAYGEAKNKTE